MKKTFIALVAAATIFASADMSAKGRTYRPHHHARYESGFELSVGYLNSRYRTKSWVNDEVTKADGLHGLSVALTKDFTIIRDILFFQTGMAYEFQSSTNRYSTNQLVTIVEETNEHYLDIPVRLKLAADVTPDIRAFVYVGPTLDFGLSSKLEGRLKTQGGDIGKLNYNYYTGKLKGESVGNFELSTPEAAYRAFDVLMGGALGVELYNVAVVKIGFDWGLINKNKNQEVADLMTTHRNLFHLGVGVRF